MYSCEDVLKCDPFSYDVREKQDLYARAMAALCLHHYEKCWEYRSILDHWNRAPSPERMVDPLDVPFLPVRLFKEVDLFSVDRSEIVRLMTSSGTTGQAVSKIYLDKTTASLQARVLIKIVSHFIGVKRRPFLVVDSPNVLKDRALFSARGAGVLGFSVLGRDTTYLLDENYRIDFGRLEAFLQKHQDEEVLLFGFTFVVWQHLVEALRKMGCSLNLKGRLIHGGGWKKLKALAVDNKAFKQSLRDMTGIENVSNYYGLIEQTGSIFMECEVGHLHASVFSDVIIREPSDFSSLSIGQVGLVQLQSLLPLSYPGHSVLTEDTGELLGQDDCPCGRKGKYFHIRGRIENAEVRGCSDVYASAS